MIPYLNICIRITIAEKYVLHNVESIEINNSLDNLSDTAKVKIPKYTTLKFDKAKAPEK